MPYLYNVERKISFKIIIVTLTTISLVILFTYTFLSNFIEKKRLKSIYDYMALEDYNNASFIFHDLLSKNPVNKNILIAGIDLYYDMLIRSEDNNIIMLSSKNIIKYSKQVLLTSKFIKNKYLIHKRLADAYQTLGASYYKDAYISYLDAINSGDDRVSTIVELSKVSYEIGHYKEAIGYLEKILKIQTKQNPNADINTILNYELANAYAGNKDYTRAIQILTSLQGKFNNNKKLEFKTYFKLGDLYFIQGLYQESEFFYKKALLIDAKNAELYYSIGKLYTKIKKPSDAYYMFREALKIDNSYKPTRDAVRRL